MNIYGLRRYEPYTLNFDRKRPQNDPYYEIHIKWVILVRKIKKKPERNESSPWIPEISHLIGKRNGGKTTFTKGKN